MRHQQLTTTIAVVVLLAAVVALAAVYRVNAQGTAASPTSNSASPGPIVMERLNDQGTPVPFVAYPATFPHRNDPLPPADSEEQVICGHHVSVHWEGRVLVVDGPDGTPVTKPCGTPGATPESQRRAVAQ
jgi:hypothetical protein